MSIAEAGAFPDWARVAADDSPISRIRALNVLFCIAASLSEFAERAEEYTPRPGWEIGGGARGDNFKRGGRRARGGFPGKTPRAQGSLRFIRLRGLYLRAAGLVVTAGWPSGLVTRRTIPWS